MLGVSERRSKWSHAKSLGPKGISDLGDHFGMARLRDTPASEAAASQSGQEPEEIGSTEKVCPIFSQDLLTRSVTTRAKGASQRRLLQTPAASRHRSTYVYDIGVIRVVSMPFEVDDGRAVHGLALSELEEPASRLALGGVRMAQGVVAWAYSLPSVAPMMRASALAGVRPTWTAAASHFSAGVSANTGRTTCTLNFRPLKRSAPNRQATFTPSKSTMVKTGAETSMVSVAFASAAAIWPLRWP